MDLCAFRAVLRSLYKKRQHPLAPPTGIFRTVCLFDARKLSRTNKRPKPLLELPHPKSTDGAVFSPVTGSHVVTICMDDKIRLDSQSQESSEEGFRLLRRKIPRPPPAFCPIGDTKSDVF